MQQGSIIDIVPLALLVLFFGIQQRGRRQTYYRFWFVGWVCVLLSYFAWGLETSGHPMKGLVEAVRLDLLLLASLVFLTSFLQLRWKLNTTMLIGPLVGLLCVAVIDLQINHTMPKALLAALVLAWEGYGMYAAHALLPPERRMRRESIFALCFVWCIAMLADIWLTGANALAQWALAEIFLCAAILYGSDHRRTTLAGVLGTVGFTTWAVFYASVVLSKPWPAALLLVSRFWNLPKYLVSFSMILKIFEDARDEESRLAKQNRSMYEDFRLLFDNNPHPSLIYVKQTGQFLLMNQAAVESYGYTEQEFLDLRREDVEVAADDEYEEIEAMLAPIGEGIRTRIRHRDGHHMWINALAHDIRYQDREARLVIMRDVTKSVKTDLEMMYRVNHDPLTGLPNRRLLEDRMETALARAVRDNNKMVVLSIDIDHFKSINDTYGHLFGDACLKAVAERLNTNIRKVDTLARVGGEEFVAVIGGLDNVADAKRIAQNLLLVMKTPLLLPDCDLAVNISIGLAVFPDDGHDSDELYRRSDEALYAAKQAGRNRFVYAGAMRAEPATPYVSRQEPPEN